MQQKMGSAMLTLWRAWQDGAVGKREGEDVILLSFLSDVFHNVNSD
jgi:hypothetical protein